MYVTTDNALVGSGLGCVDCGGGCCGTKGMGAFDLSTFSWEEWLLLGLGAWALFSVGGVASKPRKRRRRSSGSSSGLSEKLIWGAVIVSFGYLGYQAWGLGTQIGTSLAGGNQAA